MSGLCVCAGCLGCMCGLCVMCDVRVVCVFAQVVWVVYVGRTDNLRVSLPKNGMNMG